MEAMEILLEWGFLYLKADVPFFTKTQQLLLLLYNFIFSLSHDIVRCERYIIIFSKLMVY